MKTLARLVLLLLPFGAGATQHPLTTDQCLKLALVVEYTVEARLIGIPLDDVMVILHDNPITRQTALNIYSMDIYALDTMGSARFADMFRDYCKTLSN